MTDHAPVEIILWRSGPPKWETAVTLDGVELHPGPSLQHVQHSPDGFEWGYGGSGPTQLAFAILYHVTGDVGWTLDHYRKFLQIGPATWPRGERGHATVTVDLRRYVERRGGRYMPADRRP